MLRDTELKEKVLRLLKEDIGFRHAVTGLIGLEEIIRRLDKHGEALMKLREEMVKGFEANDNNLKQFREEINKNFKRYDIEFESLKRHLLNLNMHWDLMSEKAFREKLREILDKEIGLKIEKWVYYDSEGIVYGYPSQIEANIVSYNDNMLLMEFLPYVEALDVENFKKKAMLYEKITEKKLSRLIIITPYADEKSLVVAKELNIEIHIKV
jgi:hypothetical protein